MPRPMIANPVNTVPCAATPGHMALPDWLTAAVIPISAHAIPSPATMPPAIGPYCSRLTPDRIAQAYQQYASYAGEVPAHRPVSLIGAGDLAGIERLSTDTLHPIRSILKRSVSRAQARDKVKRNVVLLCDVPTGRVVRPSKAFTLNQGCRQPWPPPKLISLPSASR